MGKSDTPITVYHACAQDLANRGAEIGVELIPNTEDTLPKPLHQKLFVEYYPGMRPQTVYFDIF